MKLATSCLASASFAALAAPVLFDKPGEVVLEAAFAIPTRALPPRPIAK